MYVGDFAASSVIDFKFNTAKADGTPITLAGTPSLRCYKDNGTTESTTGLTLSVDFDSVTGLHNARVDLSSDGTFYSAGSNFVVAIAAGTVNGISVVGYVIGTFSIAARSALRPTTAGRTLDVSAGGEAGVDWANIGSPSTAVNLSATNIDTDQVVASVSGNVTGSVGSVASGGITATSIAADAIGASELAADAVTEIAAGVWAAATRTLSALDEDNTTLDLDATIRAAVGIASANLDTQLDALPTNAELATALGTADDAVLAAIAALSIPTANQNADALLDRTAGVETGMTIRQAMRVMLAALAGKASGLDLNAPVFRDTNDSKNRIVAITDETGNRTSVTLDAS